MAYINENLLKGESVVYQTNLHWIIFIKPFLLLFFCFILILLLSDIEIMKWLISPFFLYSLAWAIFVFFKYITTEFGVTNKRVLIKKGLIQRDSLEIFINKVSGIQVNQSITGRVFNFGTIIISGTGGTREYFDNINNPLTLRKHVQEQADLT